MAVSNADGSLAVRYLDTLGDGSLGYRVGTVQEGKAYGPPIDGAAIAPSGGDALRPLAWVGHNQFLTSSRDVIYINSVTPAAGNKNLSITVKALATLPEDYMSSASPVNKVVVCDDTPYWTVSMGGTQAMPTRQDVLLGVDIATGKITTYASVLSQNRMGENYRTEVMACAR